MWARARTTKIGLVWKQRVADQDGHKRHDPHRDGDEKRLVGERRQPEQLGRAERAAMRCEDPSSSKPNVSKTVQEPTITCLDAGASTYDD